LFHYCCYVHCFLLAYLCNFSILPYFHVRFVVCFVLVFFISLFVASFILVVALSTTLFKFMRREKYMRFANICRHSHCCLSLEIVTHPCILLIICFYISISHIGFLSSSSSFLKIEFLMQQRFLLSNCETIIRLFHWLPSFLILMAIFNALEKPNLTILVSNFGVVQVIENVLCAMFASWWGFYACF
jgi:hypothetical protein